MKARKLLTRTVLIVFGLVLLGFTAIRAEQIQLKDGRFIQGTIVDSDDAGFKFEITSTKGLVRLAWSQISEKDAKRLKKDDKSAEIDLRVLVEGVRLTLLDGTQVEGIGEAQDGGGWKLTNLDSPKGRTYAKKDLEEENSSEEGIKVDAFTVWEPAVVIANELESNPPVDARGWLRIAMIAEAHDLYADALGYLDSAMEAQPDETLKASIEARRPQLEELIAQAGALSAIDEANKLVRKKEYGKAIAFLKEVKTKLAKDSIVTQKIDEILERIDMAFTLQLIDDFHNLLPKEISAWVRKNKKAELGDASAFLSGTLTDLVISTLAGENAQENSEIQRRLGLRLGTSEDAMAIRNEIRTRKASFGKSGWYAAVGGPLPNAGNIYADQGNQRSGRDGDGLNDHEGERGVKFQAARDKRISKEQVEDILKKISADANKRGANAAANTPAGYEANDPKLEVPKNTPSITVFWDKLSSSRRSKWMLAAFCHSSPLIWRDQSKLTYDDVVYK